jgi:hypothetical protein
MRRSLEVIRFVMDISPCPWGPIRDRSVAVGSCGIEVDIGYIRKNPSKTQETGYGTPCGVIENPR